LQACHEKKISTAKAIEFLVTIHFSRSRLEQNNLVLIEYVVKSSVSISLLGSTLAVWCRNQSWRTEHNQ